MEAQIRLHICAVQSDQGRHCLLTEPFDIVEVIHRKGPNLIAWMHRLILIIPWAFIRILIFRKEGGGHLLEATVFENLFGAREKKGRSFDY